MADAKGVIVVPNKEKADHKTPAADAHGLCLAQPSVVFLCGGDRRVHRSAEHAASAPLRAGLSTKQRTRKRGWTHTHPLHTVLADTVCPLAWHRRQQGESYQEDRARNEAYNSK